MVAQTRKANSPQKLKFKEKLVGKGLSTDALLKKIKALHQELAEIEQENVELKTLKPVCKELISQSILLHKDKGVKAYAACCLADILRLFAPDAPYTGPELRDIFQFFFRQLSLGLTGSDAPYYTQYFHLLESLSTIKSVVLVCDLPQSDELMTQIFRDFFGLVRHDQAKNIEMFMSDILIALIDECQVLPGDVLEAIMAQFMDKNSQTNQGAYRLAVEVCNATADKLQRNVCQYFTDNIIHHAQAEDFEEVERCHALIKRLNVACPNLLHNVVPQLEEELKVTDVELRILATQTLGEMFAEKTSGELEKKYPTTWALWLARSNDKSSQVRLAFVEGCKDLLLHHRADLREAVEVALGTKLLDPEEKVRVAVCKLYSQLDYETALHYVSEKQLRGVGDRTLDKKASVRREALISIGRIFSIAYPEIENNDAAAIKQFSWIPQQILSSLSVGASTMSVTLEVLAECILPVPNKGEDEVAWTDRLLTIMRFLDDKGIITLLRISGLKAVRPNVLDIYLQACIANNGGIIDENEEFVKKRLATSIRGCVAKGSFPDPQKAMEDFQAFAKLNEQRLYKLLKTCLDPLTDLKGLVKASNEFTRRLEQSQASILPTMMCYLRQASFWIVNQSSIPTLVKRLQKGDHHKKGEGSSRVQVTANNAEKILVAISKNCAKLFRPHVSEFAKAIADDTNPRSVQRSLQALASISRIEPEITPSDKRTVERLTRYVHSKNRYHAKYATRVLVFSEDKDKISSEIIESIVDDLPNTPLNEKMESLIAVLVELVRFAPDAFDSKSDVIVEFLLKEILLKPTSEEDMELDEDADEWAEEESLSPLARAKILAIKVCRHRCLVYATNAAALDVATPVIRMLFTYLELQGMISEDCHEEPTVLSRLRLQASWSLTLLATIPVYREMIHRNFMVIALTCQDACFQVRQLFTEKLYRLLTTSQLQPLFNIIPFLTVHDPEQEIREKALGFVRMQLNRQTDVTKKLEQWELIFVRLIHLLAHHPDFGLDKENILNLAKYIQFYLQIVANANNISLLYHLAQKCKTVRDAESHTFSENLYAVSELAQEYIKGFAKQRQWSLTSYPERVKLPADIFRALPSDSARSTILKTQYLPEDIVSALFSDYSQQVQKPRQERKRKASGTKTNGTAKRSKGTGRRRKTRSDEDDEDDEDDADEFDSATDGDEVARNERVPSSPIETNDDEDDEDSLTEEETEEDLGRGARSRAKKKAQKKAKRKGRPKAVAVTSD